MIIRHNMMAEHSQRQLGVNNSLVKKSLEKLSSGYRINSAADDAAGLAISEKMRAQITGLKQAVQNAADGESLVQTAEGAMGEVHSMLNRMVELGVQSANGTLGADERQKIESELNALKEEIDRISQATNFNGIKLLDGSLDKVWEAVFTTIPSADVVPAVDTGGTVFSPYITSQGGTLDGLPDSFASAGEGKVTFDYHPDAGNKWTATGVVFQVDNRNNGSTMTYVIDLADQINNHLGDNEIYDLDLSPFGTIRLENGTSVGNAFTEDLVAGIVDYLKTINPELEVIPTSTTEKSYVQVDIEGLILQVGDTGDDYNKIAVKIADLSTAGLGLKDISMICQETADRSIKLINEAIDKVSVNRGNMGALQNRLEYVIDNQNIAIENITASESRIRDVDMAKEMMSMTKNSILAESATSMLSQANTQPQQVLQLLR